MSDQAYYMHYFPEDRTVGAMHFRTFDGAFRGAQDISMRNGIEVTIVKAVARVSTEVNVECINLKTEG